MTLSPVLLHEQPVVVLLFGRTLASLSLAIDERGGRQDLRGSGCRSVIPYVHGRTGLYCLSMPCLCEPELFFLTDLSLDPCEVAPARAFYSLRSDSYNESRGPIGGLGVGQTL
jgi:hypothetical protein